MTTEIYERKPGESPAAWTLRASAALEGLSEAFDDGLGDPDRLIITTVRGTNIGYSVTLTAVRSETVDKDPEEA